MASQTDAAVVGSGMSGPGLASRNRWLTLAVVLIGALMALLDVNIVNVAIPSLRAGLHASFGGVELVVTAYTITYACLLVTGGRLGDIFGRRRLFVAGLVVFTLSSALCGVAPSLVALVAARALQGAGGALLYPQVLSVIQVTFQGAERGKALGIFGATLGLANIAGQIVGGLLLSADLFGWSWRPIFLVNVPLGVIAVVCSLIVLPGGRGTERARLDSGGMLLAVLTVLLLVVPLLEGRDEHWPAWMITSLVAVIPAAAGFVAFERRLGRSGGSPLIRFELFGNRGMAAGVPIAAAFMLSYAGFLFILAVYLQDGLGYSPLHSGLTYTASAAGFFIMSLLAPRVVPVIGRTVLVIGYALAALGLLAVAAVASAAGTGCSSWDLVPALFMSGCGMGLGMTPLVGTIISGLAPADAGAASGIVTTALQVGGTLGVAIISLIFFSVLGNQPGAGHYATAFGATVPVSAALFVLAAVMVLRLPHGPRFGNALIEQQPGRASALAYSLFLMTGGRIGPRAFREILGEVTERRTQRIEEAPELPGDFLAYHFAQVSQDRSWLNYLAREALSYGSAPVPQEAERTPVVQRQVDEVRTRQAQGYITADLDPALVRLAAFALASYSRLLPQITRMTTGHDADDPAFMTAWESFLRRIGESLAPRA
jgi:EmrB/QacA subfamily drug resistance transporter